jgi:hypothetical protein
MLNQSHQHALIDFSQFLILLFYRKVCRTDDLNRNGIDDVEFALTLMGTTPKNHE